MLKEEAMEEKDVSTPAVGLRIRALREYQGLSLRDLAERCDLSINAISRIERGETSPTVSSLHQLALALKVPITDFFTSSHKETTVYLKQDQRVVIGKDSMMIEGLGFGLRNQQLEPFLITLKAEANPEFESITHSGEEFVYCLEGVVSYQVGDRIYTLEAGDSLLFEATQAHGYWNAGDTPIAKILIVFQASDGNPIARRYHIE